LEGEKNRTSWTSEVTKLTFGPVAKDKFTMEGWGLEPPPLDLIGSDVPTIEDAANAKPAEVSADAGKVLDKIASAYGKIQTAEVRGHVTVTATQGDTQETGWDFTARFGGPGLFRHEAPKRFYVGCDGQTEYAYTYNLNGHQWAKSYLTIPRAVAEVNRAMYPDLTLEVLDVQNPALGLLVAQDRRQQICRGAKDVVKLPDSIVDGVSCEEIAAHAPENAAQKGWTRYFSVDANTGMLRKSRFELTVPARDSEPAKTLAIDVTYADNSPGEAIASEQFAWHAPANARDLSPAWAQLIGKPAPPVQLSLLDGTKVEWSSLKGHMVLLDFWATWCGPCRMAMPHLNELYKSHKDAGLQAFAVDKEEKPELVTEYVKSSGLALPVVMDDDSAIYQKYGGDAIPMTVIIGKDGIVKDVLVGYGESNTRRLDQLISEGTR
jgi:thiol-disulfide isomerase/thioredoxin